MELNGQSLKHQVVRVLQWLARGSGVDPPPAYGTLEVLSHIVFYSCIHHCHEQSQNVTGERLAPCLGALLC